MATFGSRRGFSDKLSLPLMVLAFLAVGGFLYWLSITAKPTEVEIVEEVQSSSGASAILAVGDFLAAPGQYQGQLVEVTGARIATRLGSQAFWIGPDDAPFLVRMGPAAMEAAPGIMVEQVVTLVGTVHTMSDSILDAWDAAGAFPNAADRTVASFATAFLEAESVAIQRGPAGGTGG